MLSINAQVPYVSIVCYGCLNSDLYMKEVTYDPDLIKIRFVSTCGSEFIFRLLKKGGIYEIDEEILETCNFENIDVSSIQ